MASEYFHQRMERACENLEIPGAVLFASDASGKFTYGKSFGNRSLKDGKPDPMPIDATMWLASCTKLITTIAAMQCVERGLLNLDDDVTTILPELKGAKILAGFEEGPDGKDKPVLVENTKVITLRHLLTHSSGLSYDVFNPLLMRYRATQGRTPNLKHAGDMVDSFTFPLLFSPGDAWEYSVGIDWAGWMVERVNGNVSLEAYLEKNVWGPLDMKSMTFHPKTSPATWSKLADMSEREGGVSQFGTANNPEGKLYYTSNTVWNQEPSACAGGAGGYGSPLDYNKMLHSIIADDGKLLKPETVADMFRPHLSKASQQSLMDKLKIPEVNQSLGGLPLGTKVDWGLGGMLIMEDLSGARRKGTMTWGGYPNLIWFADRSAGLAGIYGSQINPPGDAKTNELFGLWTQEIYKQAGKAGPSSKI